MPRSIMKKAADDILAERKEAEAKTAEYVRSNIVEHVCPVCGKPFIPAPYHAYKIAANVLVCSYTCSLTGDKRRKRYKKWGG